MALTAYGEECSRRRLRVATTSKRSTGKRPGARQSNLLRYAKDRVTEMVEFGPRQHEVNELMRAALTRVVEPTLRTQIDWMETPQVLRYETGGFYASHSDSGEFDVKAGRWKKILDRDVSTLIYLNENYQGGQLRFNNFNYDLQPSIGMLLFFPSDPRYTHESLPITRGVKFAVASWAATAGVKRIFPSPPASALRVR